MTSPISVTTKTPAPGFTATVQVPGTSANLGPGFDSLGLAVSLYDTLGVTTLAGDALEFDLHGEGVAELPRDAGHLVVKAMDLAFARLGYRRGGLRITAENVLPHGRGLGSSASAIVAAIAAANALVAPADRQDKQWVLQLASEMEGHPDNVAPAIFGAVAISWQDDGAYSTTRLTPSDAVIPVVAIPNFEVKTELARGLLPATVPHADAAANSGRAALLMHALKDAPELLAAGTRDYLHQDYRAAAMPASAALVAALRAEGHAAFISGAGPTVMALANGATEADAMVEFIARQGADRENPDTGGVSWRVLRLTVDLEGAKVEVHPGS
ncbi:homoserine kinase [Arthrobacter livingstonensis]|uniref:Homoserine kinase n=1 Tax=Arthrobacter livingstonensis TaxID=670078 RepID=A0A2V5LAL5_9MICC|nr:homoserine kinase [Arthrobacter livingstonensis]PYI68681.1 homoserine kinase [Arthrobacter livingstonensis]